MSLATEGWRPGANSARLDVTAVSGSVAIPSGPGNVVEVEACGNGTTTLDFVFFVTGTGAQTAALIASGATGPGWAVAPGQRKRVRVPPGHDTIAAITAATKTATIFVSRGDGSTT